MRRGSKHKLNPHLGDTLRVVEHGALRRVVPRAAAQLVGPWPIWLSRSRPTSPRLFPFSFLISKFRALSCTFVPIGIYHYRDQHFLAILVLFARSRSHFDQGKLAVRFHFVDADVRDSVNVLKQFALCSHDEENHA